MKTFIEGQHPTYKQQFDKLTEAYIENKVNPWSMCACFVGNLLNGEGKWYSRSSDPTDLVCPNSCVVKESKGLYNIEEILELEDIFLTALSPLGGNKDSSLIYFNLESAKVPYQFKQNLPEYETILFEAFEKTLEALKKLHISKGENVEGTYTFVKRELQLA